MRLRFPCPCCGFRTLDSEPPGTYGLCPVCWWEDDQVQFNDPEFQGGANGVSLRQARGNFARFGAIDQHSLPFVRAPRPGEERLDTWSLP